MSQSSSFSLPPPPAGNSTGGFSGSSGFSLPPPPSHTPPVQSGLSAFSKPAASTGMGMGMMSQQPMNGMNSMGSRPGMGMSMASSGSMNSMMNSNMDMNGMAGLQQQQQQQQQKPQQKSGLDKYESLI